MHNTMARSAVPEAAALVGLKRDKEPTTIARALAGAGWRVTVAESADSLIAIANAELPELAVVDATFPPLPDGRHPAEALRSVGAKGHRPRIVLVANERDGHTISLAASTGASDVLVVPASYGSRTGASDTGRASPRQVGPSLWVVDDSPAIRMLARSAFERADWQVSEFEDLGSAQAALKAGGAPAAVLLDIHLPDGNGLDHVRHFTAAGAAVVMLSNLAGPDQVERAFAAGAIDIVAKPFDLRSLVARAERAVKWAPPAAHDRQSPPLGEDPAGRPNIFSTQWL